MRRASFLAWHRRLALLFAPLILLQAFTGSLLLFREPLGRLLEATPTAGPVIGVDRLFSVAAATGKRVDRLQLPAEPGRIAIAQLAASDGTHTLAMIDPVSARILREGGLATFPIEAALRLHYQLQAGTTGLFIVMLTGFALVLMAGTGLAFWWPVKARWRKSLAINPRMPARVRLRHWHRNFGVVAAILIGCSGATGILLAGADLLPMLSSPAAKSAVTTGQRVPLAADVATGLDLAKAEFPGAQVRDLRFAPDGRMDVNLRAPERNSLAVHVVKIDLVTSRIVRVIAAQDNPAMWMKILPYHSGDEFGLLGQLILLIEALVLIGLSISGPVMWWQKRKSSK
jgi:uncharacterized iron-regulated membrane protein